MRLWDRVLARLRKPEFKRYRVSLSAVIVTQRDELGRVVHQETLPNRLFDEGEDIFLNEGYRAVSSFPTAWWGRLCGGAPADADDILDITGEPLPTLTTGYMPIAWSRGTLHWGAITTLGADRVVYGSKFSFGPAITAWSNITTFLFATLSHNVGTKLFARFSMTSRTVPVGQTLDIQPIGVVRGVTS